MSDGGRGRASLGVGGLKSSQKWSAQRSAVRSIAWLDALESLPPDSSTTDPTDTEKDTAPERNEQGGRWLWDDIHGERISSSPCSPSV
jgi:hypothetical protein